MDADLRWNGKLPRSIQGMTFFSTEVSLNETSPYRQMLLLLGKFGEAQYLMRNVSFVSFGNFDVTEAFKNVVRQLWTNYSKALDSDQIGKTDKIVLARLIEQIILSIACQDEFEEVMSLKEIDRHMDGQFVESCYFGATGYVFS